MSENQAATVESKGTFEHKNDLFIAGELVKILSDGFEVKSTVIGTDRDTGKETPRSEQNICICDPEALKAIGAEIGSRIQLYGRVGQDAARIKRVYAYRKSLALTKLPFDCNSVTVSGIVGTVVYTPPDPILKKQGMARATVTVDMPGGGKQGVPIVMFQDMARNWEKVPPGSEVCIGGRMRCQARNNGRAFVNSNGDLNLNRFTEVVCNPGACRVAKRAQVFNPFAGVNMAAFYDEGEAQDGPAPAASAESQTEAPKKPGRPSKKQAMASVAAEEPAF